MKKCHLITLPEAVLIFKLDKNLYNNTNDISSYRIVAQNLYEYLLSRTF